MKSNVALRANVNVGTLEDLRAGKRLVKSVRGRSALLALLRRLEPGQATLDAARAHLGPVQLAELLQDACSECGLLAIGPARSVDGPLLQVRCPLRRCRGDVVPTRVLLCDSRMAELLGALMRRFTDLDLAGIVVEVLSVGRTDVEAPLDLVVSRVPIRLPPALHYQFYAWTDQALAKHVKAHMIRFQTHG